MNRSATLTLAALVTLGVTLAAGCERSPGGSATPIRPTPPPPAPAAGPGAGAAPAPDPAADPRFAAPEGWIAEPPSSSMRLAQYRLPGEVGEANLVIFYFGTAGAGQVDANLDRWCGQLSQPDGRDSREVATRAEREVDGTTIHELDLTGTFVAEMPPGSGVRVNEEGYRLLASIVMDEAHGPLYVKLVGPDATVAEQMETYRAFVDGLVP
ncbi:MAG: hypothetical protein ACYTG1_13940 [Planctomycetota bacterium]|jgi:hypothetical protein